MDKKSIETKRNTKSHLKTLTKNGKVKKLRTTRRVVKYGTAGFVRNIWLSIAATIVMTITLLILSLTVVANIVLSQTADSLRDKIDITVFFKPQTEDGILTEAKSIMLNDSNVKSVEIANSKEEYQRFLDENTDNEKLMEVLNDEEMQEIMINTMQSTMRIKVKDVDNLDSIKDIVKNNELFKNNLDPEKEPSYDVNQTQIKTITSWANIAKNGGIILGIVFLVISILIIFNTIRMSIFSRREEIKMMKLVGADRHFIRGPFLVEARICGMISGFIAGTAGYVGMLFMTPKLTEYGIDVSVITSIIKSEWIIAVYAALIALGMIIGTFSAKLAIRKYLH